MTSAHPTTLPCRLRPWWPLLLVGLATGIGACSDDSTGGLEVSGTVEVFESDLGFELPGRISEVRVVEGDRVEPGDTLALLDVEEIRAGVEAAEARVSGAEAAVEEARTGARPGEIRRAEAEVRDAEREAELARTEAERARRLHEGGAISREQLDRAETRRTVAEARLAAATEALELTREGPRDEQVRGAEARLAEARSSLARARAQAERGVLRSPLAATVAVRHRDPGEVVGAGAPLLTLQDLSDRWVRVYIPEDRIGRVALGQSAEIRSDSWPDRTFEGEVIFIGAEAEFTPRNVQTQEERTRLVYPVKVKVRGDDEVELRPGTPADVRIAASGPGTGGP